MLAEIPRIWDLVHRLLAGCDYYHDAMAPTYLAMVKRLSGPDGGAPIHLVREGSEASLCGLPTSALSNLGPFDVMVCAGCIEWLPRRMAATGKYPRATPADPK